MLYQDEIRELNVSKGWRHEDTLADRYAFPAHIALVHSELSEALEAYRDKQWSETGKDGKPLGIGPELADVYIRLVDMCDIWNIDLDAEIRRVLDYGWTRPYQHEGKVC